MMMLSVVAVISAIAMFARNESCTPETVGIHQGIVRVNPITPIQMKTKLRFAFSYRP